MFMSQIKLNLTIWFIWPFGVCFVVQQESSNIVDKKVNHTNKATTHWELLHLTTKG